MRIIKLNEGEYAALKAWLAAVDCQIDQSDKLPDRISDHMMDVGDMTEDDVEDKLPCAREIIDMAEEVEPT